MAVQRGGGGLGDMHPTSHQHQVSNSFNFDERILGPGRPIAHSMNRSYQVLYLIFLGVCKFFDTFG